MSDFSSICSLEDVQSACEEGRLAKILLLPDELGGREIPENVVYVPLHLLETKKNSTVELINVVRNGLNDIHVFPEYRGTSIVPAKISITAARKGMPPEYELEIRIW